MCRTVIQKCDFSGGCDKPSTCRDFMGLCQDHYNELYEFVFEDDDEEPFTVTAPAPPELGPPTTPVWSTVAHFPRDRYRIIEVPSGWDVQIDDKDRGAFS